MNKVAENPSKNRTVPYPIPLVIVSAVFVTLYLVSNIMAVKIVGIGKWIYFDAGTLTFPFAYMLGDVLTEIWGYKTAKRVILLTLTCNILLVLCTWIGVFLPVPDYNDALPRHIIEFSLMSPVSYWVPSPAFSAENSQMPGLW